MGRNNVSEAVGEVAWAALTAQPEAELETLLATEVIELDQLHKSLNVVEDDAELAAGFEELGSPSTLDPITDLQMYNKLRDKLLSPEFLQQLKANNESETPLAIHDGNATLLKEEHNELGSGESYVVITQQDVIDAVACFVARSISALPQTKTMSPDALQQAIVTAFLELQTTGKLQSLWSCAHLLYAATSWGSTALGLYKNPIVRRAAWMAVYTSSSIILRLFP